MSNRERVRFAEMRLWKPTANGAATNFGRRQRPGRRKRGPGSNPGIGTLENAILPGRIDQNPNFGRRESPRIKTHKNNVYLSTIPPSQSKIVGNSYNLIMDDTFPPIGTKILRYSC